MNEILEAVLNSLWQAAAVAAVVWLLLKWTPRINAATRYAVWWAVLAVVVLLPMATEYRLLTRAAPNKAATRESSTRESSTRESATPEAPFPAATVREWSPPPAVLMPHTVDAGNWPVAVFALWALVCLVLMARIGWSYRHLRRIKGRARPAPRELQSRFDARLLACAIPRQVRLLVSREIGSPMAAGFRHPAVLLPEPLVDQFTEAELDHVLLHELAHVARRDDWTNLWARLAGALLALHPVAAWVVHRIDREREIACDDWVVAQTGDARPYAASLARLFELCCVGRRTLLASGMAESGSHLGDRIEMLLRRGREFTPRTSVLRVAGMVVVLAACAAAGARMPRWIIFSPRSAQTARALAGMPVALAAETKGSFLAALVASGYGDLTVDEIVELKDQGISGAYLMGMSQAGWGKIPPKELIDLHAQGVDPGYVRTMREAGLRDLRLADVIRLKQHGVPPDYVREIHACGLGPYTAAEAIDFAAQGVPADLFCALQAAGFQQASTREIIDAKNQGLRPQHLREAEKFGSKLTLRQVVKLKQAGVI
ncbi:MAG TPA: M56 family metallopeptidase [Candidatus Acidoferrales bacterium]|nr:M56 family metallopeptidase [Candidatus Acidoferrales bacterium]